MSAPLIIDKVTRRFGSKVALDEVSIEVPRGSVYGLLGPNGAGKSTLFSVACGWIKPHRGDINICGTHPRQLHKKRGKVGVMPQDSAFPPQLPIDRQLQHYARLQGFKAAEAKQISADLLSQMGLTDSSKVRGSQLSHGMLKRVALAQAFIGDPELILLDEPTNGLDPENRRRVLDMIMQRKGDRTIVISSHLLSDIQEVCTHAAVLQHGRLMVQDSIDNLLGASSRVSVRVRDERALPLDALRSRWGPEAVKLANGLLQVDWPDGADGPSVLREVLELLFKHDVQVLDASQSASLESVFLKLTAETTALR